MKKLRIAHIAGGMTFGGVEAVIYNYFSHMNLDEYELTYISYDTPDPLVKGKFERLGFKVYEVTKKRKNFIKSCLEVYRILRERRINILHSHMNHMCFVTSMIGIFAGIRIRIAHSHLSSVGNGDRGIVRAFFKCATRFTSTRYMACGTAAAQYLFGGENNIFPRSRVRGAVRASAALSDRGRVTIFKNAVDVRQFAFNPALRAKTRRCLSIGEKLCIGHAGRFTDQKNHDFIIEIFREIHRIKPESVLLLAGIGPLENEIKRKVKALGLNEDVIYAGGVCDMTPLYQAMDVFILPSLYEGFPVVIAEAAAAGLPVFASDRIDPDVGKLGDAAFLSLESGASRWAERILACPIGQREVGLTKISENGFLIEDEAKKLDAYYTNLQ